LGKSFFVANQRDCQLAADGETEADRICLLAHGEKLVGITVREDDADVGHFLAAGHRGATGAGLEAFQDGTVFDDGAFDGEAVGREIVVVLGVRDGALERLGDQAGGLARDERQIIDGFRGFAALDGTNGLRALSSATCVRSG